MNLDMRYLRKDELGDQIHLDMNDETGSPCGWKGLDVERQNKFVAELKRFGWSSVLGWKYWDRSSSPATGTTWDAWYAVWRTEYVNEEVPVLKDITHDVGHQHHIHLQGY